VKGRRENRLRTSRQFWNRFSIEPLLIFCLLFPFANATAQLNSNEPCSKFVNEDGPPPFSKQPTKEQLSRADRLYSRSIIITAHDHCYSTQDFVDMKAGGITVRTIKLTTDNNYWSSGDAHPWPPDPVPDPTGQKWRSREVDFSQPARDAIKIVKDNPDVSIIHSRADVLKSKRTGKLGVIVSFEGGAVAPRPEQRCLETCEGEKCMSSIRSLYSIGLREFQPYWVTDNWLKSLLIDGRKRDDDWERAPLNCYGVRILEELDRLGVIIDLSHMGVETVHEVLNERRRKPFILSHAAVARVSLCGSNWAQCPDYDKWATTGASRTDSPLLESFSKEFGPPGGTAMLDDDTIHEVVRRHGVIALHFMGFFVCWKCSSGEDATVANLVDEIEYFKRTVGIDYVALGPDYIPSKGPRGWVRGVRDMTELKNVAREMVIRGCFSDLDIQKVLGLNLLRLYGSVWKVPQP
jgi:microsomal dipeptidase-like Zn-dependent dipeptidase